MKKYLASLLCVALIVFAMPMQLNAYERKEHDEIMLTILFRKFSYACNNADVQDELDVLKSACYLAIDQFNSSGQKDLDILKNYKVKKLPDKVEQIGYKASGRNHRDFTHRGWNFSYTGEMAELWPKRQNVLRRAVAQVFNLKVDDPQTESFCELLYYIHIIGDHEDDESYMISNGRKIDVGGRHDNEDIIHKLLELFEVLFNDQRDSHKYRGLTANLQSIDSELSKLINSEGGINSDEKFQKHQELVKELIDILSLYIPEMLKKEPFFNDVFYKGIQHTDVMEWFEDWFANAA